MLRPLVLSVFLVTNRKSHTDNLSRPAVNTAFAGRAFRSTAPHIWDRISHSPSHRPSIVSEHFLFRRQLKTLPLFSDNVSTSSVWTKSILQWRAKNPTYLLTKITGLRVWNDQNVIAVVLNFCRRVKSFFFLSDIHRLT